MYLVKRGSGSDRVVDDLQVDDVVERAHAREGAVLVAAAVRERHRLDEVVLRVLHVDAELGVVAEVGVHAERARRRAAAVAHLDQFLVHHLRYEFKLKLYLLTENNRSHKRKGYDGVIILDFIFTLGDNNHKT